MLVKQDFDLIITIVDKGFTDPILKASREAGAEGSTIITGRGTSIHETDTILGVAIQPEKELVLIIVKHTMRKKIMKKICEVSNLNQEGKGLTFSLPIDELAGVTHLMSLAKWKNKVTAKVNQKKQEFIEKQKQKKTQKQDKKQTQKEIQQKAKNETDVKSKKETKSAPKKSTKAKVAESKKTDKEPVKATNSAQNKTKKSKTTVN